MNAAGKVGIGVGGNFRAGRSGVLGYMSSWPSAPSPMSSEIQSVVASLATEEDDLLSRSTKKCKRRSSGDFFWLS